MTDQLNFKIDITAEDEQVLRNAKKAYIDDMNAVANGDIYSVDNAGWLDTNEIANHLWDSFTKLADAHLVEREIILRRCRITQLGMDTVAALDKAEAMTPLGQLQEIMQGKSSPTTNTEPKKPININRPPHLVANELIIAIEDYLWAEGAGVKFGAIGHELVEEFVAQYNKAIQDVENERDIRGDILDTLVGIRADLINKDSNSWIDSVQQIKQEIISGRWLGEEYVKMKRELKVLEQILDERNRLLAAIPECEVHGQCVPHALEWIEESKSIRADYKKSVEQTKWEKSKDGVERDPWASNPKARPMPHPGSPKTVGFVTVEPRKGMWVATPAGKGKIEAVGDNYIIVGGKMYEPYQVSVLDVSPAPVSEGVSVLVMTLSMAGDPNCNVLYCENLSEFSHALESIFTGGDPKYSFEEFWDENAGVDIRFKRFTREVLKSFEGEWKGFY